MNTITMEKKWSGENRTNRTGGDGPAICLIWKLFIMPGIGNQKYILGIGVVVLLQASWQVSVNNWLSG